MKRTVVLAALLCACTYDPPPEVELLAPPNNQFLADEPLQLAFSEPVLEESLELYVWPGRKDRYDIEGALLPGVEPLLDRCTPATSPCGPDGGVTLTLDAARTLATLNVADGALGPLGQPLRLEVTGRLADGGGRAKKVSRFFDFQLVDEIWDPYAEDAQGGDSAEDTTPTPPVDVESGPHLFFAELSLVGEQGNVILELPQQFWADMQIAPATGAFVGLMTDADPVDGAHRNTSEPEDLVLDVGEEGFIFTVVGQISHDEADGHRTDGGNAGGASAGGDGGDSGLVFQSEPFTLQLNISAIAFELRDAVIAGRITVGEEDGLSRWDGTMAVREVMYRVLDIETIYGEQRANFQITQLRAAETPDAMPCVCDAAPCDAIKGPQCDLSASSPWPPTSVCPAL